MVDIFDFIDSKDIRKYNLQLGTKFTPIEQAVLIYHSDLKTVEEKLAAWNELLDAYNEENFSEINLPDGGKVTNRDIMFGHTYRQKVEITVKAFEKALKLKSNTEGMLYIVKIYANADSQAYDTTYKEAEFSSFEKAFLESVFTFSPKTSFSRQSAPRNAYEETVCVVISISVSV